jgi:hypothetical protein
MYDWAKFRRAKGAVKLHLVLDHVGGALEEPKAAVLSPRLLAIG